MLKNNSFIKAFLLWSECFYLKKNSFEKIVITYMDKVTYECWLLDENSEENYGYYNDVIYPISVIEEISKQNQKTK